MEVLLTYNVGLSSVSILKNPSGSYYYLVSDVEPDRYEAIAKLVGRVLERLNSRRSVGVYDIAKTAHAYLRNYDLELITYVVNRELKYKKIQVLLDDPYVEDISIVGPGPVWVRHKYVLEKDPAADYIETNIAMSTHEEFMNYMELIAERSGRVVNRRNPIIDFTLPEEDGGHRVHVVLPDVAYSSGEIVIRKKPHYAQVGLDTLVETGMLPPQVAELIKTAIRRNGSVVILGPPGSGKTTLLKAILYSAIPKHWKIAVIEDTPEVDIPKDSSWVRYTVPTSVWGSERGIDQMSLAKAALRASVSRFLVIGETRGAEARVLAQAMNMGLGGLCLPADQLVLARVDGRIDLYEIGRIVEKIAKEGPGRVEVVSIGPKFEPVWQPVSAAVVKSGSRRFARIEVDEGAVHEVHEDHSVVVVDGESGLVLRKAKELKPGDLLLSLQSPPKSARERKFVDVREILSRYSNNSENSVAADFREVISAVATDDPDLSTPKPLELSEELGYVLGLYLATGSIEKDSSSSSASAYFGVSKAIFSRVVEALKKLEVEKIEVAPDSTQSSVVKVGARSRVLISVLLGTVGWGAGSSSKKVPLELLIESPERFRVGFLRGYCDGVGLYGSVDEDGVIEIRTHSRKVAESLSLILRTLRVSSSVRLSRSESGELYVVRVDRDVDRFLRIVVRGRAGASEAGNEVRENLEEVEELALLRVRSVDFVEKDSPLYDVEVPGTHLYAISGSLVLTHNTTFHAGSPEEAIVRLTSPPIELTPQQLSMIWLFVTLGFVENGGLKRVVTRVDEPVLKSGALLLNTIYKYGEDVDLDALFKRFSRIKEW